MSTRRRSRRHELVESIAQGAALLTADGEVVAVNATARRLLGMSEDARAWLAADALIDPELAHAVAEVWRTERPATVEVLLGERHLRASLSLVRDELLLLLSDRTEERRIEELRRDFVANASHELKTPVTGIQSLADALGVVVHDQPERIPALVARLSNEAERLVALVHDLLDLRRLEEGGPPVGAEVDLAELVRQVAASLYGRAEAVRVQLSVEAPDRLPVPGIASDLRLLVQNLVVNAIRYNLPGGSVYLTLRTLEPPVCTQPGAGVVELAVKDTGIGISPADLPRVFERFYRVDNARSRQTGGTGLGLSIVRHVAEQHGGSIDVASELGGGTTFTVRLPTGHR